MCVFVVVVVISEIFYILYYIMRLWILFNPLVAVIVQGPGGCICSAFYQDLLTHPGQNGALTYVPLW